ncbi:MAG: tripartite tricarboxylate transporter substrate binding protein [Betaproteobacteria bacterium]|nr:MAG: tripartite tricarboxylate transporter substrate binding protein [Betaproteobacteria bacterium]
MKALVFRIAALVALALCAVGPQAAFAQSWPAKPVKFVVPYPPGGSTDPMARMIGAKLSDSLGQPFVVENRSGASGTIGTAFVAKSPADGYTFIFVFDYHAVNPFLIRNLPFDTVKDLAPVMLIGTAPMAIATGVTKPYKSFTDVVATARAKPGTVSIGSVGNGSLGHLTMVLVQHASGIRLIHIPYKGGGPMTADAVGGQIDLAIGSVAVITPHVNGGRLRAVAVTGDRRSRALPDVPALAEQGLPGFSALAWWAVFAPAGVPKPIMDKFHAELVKAFNLPDVRKLLTETLGIDLVVGSPEGLAQWLDTQMQRWGKVVRENDIRAD